MARLTDNQLAMLRSLQQYGDPHTHWYVVTGHKRRLRRVYDSLVHGGYMTNEARITAKGVQALRDAEGKSEKPTED